MSKQDEKKQAGAAQGAEQPAENTQANAAGSEQPSQEETQAAATQPAKAQPAAGGEKDEVAPKSKGTEAKTTSKHDALVKEYSKLYPKCRKFHVASDGMVFLEADLNAAQLHQRSLPDGQLETLKRAE